MNRRKDPAAGSPRRRRLRIIRRMLAALLVIFLLSAAFVIIADAAVRKRTAPSIITADSASEFGDADCILVLGFYISEKLGIEAVGVAAEGDGWGGSGYRESREILARAKDFVKLIFKPKPVYLGEMIPISGDGDLTDD